MEEQNQPLLDGIRNSHLEFLDAIAHAVEPHHIAPNLIDVLHQRKALLEAVEVFTPPGENQLCQLAKVVAAAFPMAPPHYLKSIFGPVFSWLPPHHASSELSVLDVWRPLQTLKYLTSISVPAVSRAPGKVARTLLPQPVQNLFWRESCYFQQPDPFQSTTSYLDERWFFINGVATTPEVARINTELLSQMFHRPLTGIYNSTNSLALDLIECALDKRLKLEPDLDDPRSMTAPTYAATRAILSALKDQSVERVVVIAHSQGTIIAANVIRAIARTLRIAEALTDGPSVADLACDPLEQLACQSLLPKRVQEWRKDQLQAHLLRLMRKLEFYLFSNCADRLTYAMKVTTKSGAVVGLPYIENFANEYDLIARLGILSPLRKSQPELVSLDGPLYLGTDQWGHFLNAHYLQAIQDHLTHPERVDNPYQRVDAEQPLIPRLYRYFGGERPG